jgi:hypothetical protein
MKKCQLAELAEYLFIDSDCTDVIDRPLHVLTSSQALCGWLRCQEERCIECAFACGMYQRHQNRFRALSICTLLGSSGRLFGAFGVVKHAHVARRVSALLCELEVESLRHLPGAGWVRKELTGTAGCGQQLLACVTTTRLFPIPGMKPRDIKMSKNARTGWNSRNEPELDLQSVS